MKAKGPLRAPRKGLPVAHARWLVAAHHDLNNHLAAARFTAQSLAASKSKKSREMAHSMERATLQAGVLLGQAESLLGSSPPRYAYVTAEAVIDAVAQRLCGHGLPEPRRKLSNGLSSRLRIPYELVRETLVALAVSGWAARAENSELELRARRVDLRVALELLHSGAPLAKTWRSQNPPRGRGLILRLAEHLFVGTRVDVRVSCGAKTRVTLLCPTE